MNSDDFDDGQEHEDQDQEQDDREVGEALEEALELGAQSKIVLEMRRQNLDLLRLAAEIAGYAGPHGPLKPGDLKAAIRNIWGVFSQCYTWIDPELAEDDEEEGDEDDRDDEQ